MSRLTYLNTTLASMGAGILFGPAYNLNSGKIPEYDIAMNHEGEYSFQRGIYLPSAKFLDMDFSQLPEGKPKFTRTLRQGLDDVCRAIGRVEELAMSQST